jgi:tyrosyl-tRNA synthetase
MTKLALTKSEARRLIAQGGVSIDGEKVSDYNTMIPTTDFIVKVGKRKFLKIIH